MLTNKKVQQELINEKDLITVRSLIGQNSIEYLTHSPKGKFLSIVRDYEQSTFWALGSSLRRRFNWEMSSIKKWS